MSSEKIFNKPVERLKLVLPDLRAAREDLQRHQEYLGISKINVSIRQIEKAISELE